MLQSRIRGTSLPLLHYSRVEHCLSIAVVRYLASLEPNTQVSGFMYADVRLESDALLFGPADRLNTWIGLSDARV